MKYLSQMGFPSLRSLFSNSPIQNVLPKWMVEHVSTLDAVTSQFIKSRMDDED